MATDNAVTGIPFGIPIPANQLTAINSDDIKTSKIAKSVKVSLMSAIGNQTISTEFDVANKNMANILGIKDMSVSTKDSTGMTDEAVISLYTNSNEGLNTIKKYFGLIGTPVLVEWTRDSESFLTEKQIAGLSEYEIKLMIDDKVAINPKYGAIIGLLKNYDFDRTTSGFDIQLTVVGMGYLSTAIKPADSNYSPEISKSSVLYNTNNELNIYCALEEHYEKRMVSNSAVASGGTSGNNAGDLNETELTGKKIKAGIDETSVMEINNIDDIIVTYFKDPTKYQYIPVGTPTDINGTRFTSLFGKRPPPDGGSTWHKGVDLAGPNRTIMAVSPGTVVLVKENGSGYGNYIKIKHGDTGFYTLYAHLDRIDVQFGATVNSNQQIGIMGGTSGTATKFGIHLHYEIQYSEDGKNFKKVDPIKFLFSKTMGFYKFKSGLNYHASISSYVAMYNKISGGKELIINFTS